MSSEKYIYTLDDGSGRPKRERIDNAIAIKDKLFTIGSSGDFENISSALEYLDSFPTTSNIELRILSGHVIQEHLSLKNKDYRNVILTSEDDVVLLSRDYMLQASSSNLPFISADNTNVFSLATQIKMDNSGTLFSGNNNLGNYKSGVFLNNKSTFIMVDDYVSGKVAGLSDFLGAAVQCFDSTCKIGSGSYIRNTGTGQNFGTDYTFSGGALVWVCNLMAGWGSSVTIIGSTIENSAHHNLDIALGSTFYIQQSTIVDAGGTGKSINCRGGNFSLVSSTARKTTGVDSTDDVAVSSGSFGRISNSTCGTSQDPNIITANGIIFR